LPSLTIAIVVAINVPITILIPIAIDIAVAALSSSSGGFRQTSAIFFSSFTFLLLIVDFFSGPVADPLYPPQRWSGM
jgi:hypothetical protein